MRIIDRILLILASFCLSSILIIIFTGKISSNHSALPIQSNKEIKKEVHSSGSETDDMIVYSQEIDETISKYFQSIRENPEIDEEEKRLVEDIMEGNESKKEIKDRSSQEIKKSHKKLKSGIIRHVVRKGESLWRLSNKFNVPVYTIVSANPSKAKQVIHPGDKLEIPLITGIFYKVKKGDYLGKIASRFKINVFNIKLENRLKSSLLKKGQKIFLPGAKPPREILYKSKSLFSWPLRGKITSYYGWRIHPIHRKKHFHAGVDIAAKSGSRIRAIAKGVVIYSGKSGNYGNTIILRHKNGYMSVYAHCSRIYAKKGLAVKRGQVIGLVGASGLVTGSHLHFEMKRYKKPLNPITALKKKIKVPIS